MSGDDSATHNFYIGGFIDDEVANVVVSNLLEADNYDQDAYWDITLNSEGGEVAPGLAIYETIARFSERMGGNHWVNMRIYGQCMSMATLISQAGDYRITSKLTTWMLHPVITGDMGGKSLASAYSELDSVGFVEENSIKLLLQRSNLNPVDYKRLHSGCERYFTGDDALRFGFVDEVV